MKKRDLVKAIAGTVSGAGASYLTGYIIGRLVPTPVKIVGKIGYYAGALVIGSVVAKKVEDRTSEIVDEVAEVFDTIVICDDLLNGSEEEMEEA